LLTIALSSMQFPVTISIFNQPVLLHGILEALGIFAGFRYYLYLRKKRGDSINSPNRLWILIGATFGAVIGSRLLGSLENVPQWITSKHYWLYFVENKTIAGGLLGGLIGVEIAKKGIGERHNSGDLFVYPLLFAMIIGRLGCFSAGIHEETYGLPSHLPWAMDLGDGIRRHPVTLYEILFLIATWVLIWQLNKRYIFKDGATFKIFLALYLLFRFLLDFIKPGWRYFFGLGSIQIACLLGLLYYIRYIQNPRLLIIEKCP